MIASNGTYYAGCDVGSTTGKAVILDDHNIVATAVIPSEIDPEETARKVLDEACRKINGLAGPDMFAYLVGTGYGRNEVPFAQENVSEISCHAMGVHFCDPDIQTIVDIGGQDVKGIALNPDGSVQEFAMNDKCAAGTGRFLEMMSRLFRMDLPEFSRLSWKPKKSFRLPPSARCLPKPR